MPLGAEGWHFSREDFTYDHEGNIYVWSIQEGDGVMGKLTATRDLAARLRKIKVDYDEAATKDDTTPAWRDRDAAFHSLQAVVDYINKMPDWRGLDFALVRLLTALADIERGIQVNWLSAESQPARPELGLNLATVRGRLAAIMDLLMKAGHSREFAAKIVFQYLPSEAAALLGGADISWRTIARWRDEVTGHAKESAERKAYEEQLALVGQHGIDFERKARAMVELLAKYVT